MRDVTKITFKIRTECVSTILPVCTGHYISIVARGLQWCIKFLYLTHFLITPTLQRNATDSDGIKFIEMFPFDSHEFAEAEGDEFATKCMYEAMLNVNRAIRRTDIHWRKDVRKITYE